MFFRYYIRGFEVFARRFVRATQQPAIVLGRELLLLRYFAQHLLTPRSAVAFETRCSSVALSAGHGPFATQTVPRLDARHRPPRCAR